jgi:hypothetical protein
LDPNSRFYKNSLFDATTGEKVGDVKSPALSFPSVVGHYLIGMTEGTGANGRGRSDNKAMTQFVIVDVKDPANPNVVSDKKPAGLRRTALRHLH